jgi:hypothetical protein
LSALVAVAQARGIPITGIELSPKADEARQGDSVTLLLGLFDSGHERQWLVTVQTDELTPTEQKQRPPIANLVRYTTTGNELRYHTATDIALRLRIIGPFLKDEGTTSAPSPAEENERILVSSEFLRFGLDEICRIWLQIQAKLKQLDPAESVTIWRALQLESSSRRFPSSVVDRTRAAAAKINFTADDERPFYGVELTIESFVRIIQASPAMNRIFDQVVERPSWWSTVTHLGSDGQFTTTPEHIRLLAPSPWSTGSSTYQLPFQISLNGQPALAGELAVTAPQPPLIACAGVLGFNAAPPHNPDRLLQVRLLAARRGTGPQIAHASATP